MTAVTKRHVLLGAALLATLAAAWFAPTGDPAAGVVDATRPAAARTAAAPRMRQRGAVPVQAVGVLAIRPRTQSAADDASDAALFASLQPAVSPAPASAPAVAAAEPMAAASSAPPLPFKLLGRIDEPGRSAVFLQYNDQNLVVRVGETIADQYRVESLKGSTLTLLYLPLNQTQTLDVGGARTE
jgi:hypothetical protein